MTTDMKIKAIAPWFGTKRTLAHKFTRGEIDIRPRILVAKEHAK